jgi:uridine kinase
MKCIAIGGCSGSGKTYFAAALSQHLGSFTIISIDDYYLGLERMPHSRDQKTTFDHPSAIEWPLLREQVALLLKGHSQMKPVYDFRNHKRAGFDRVHPADFLIVEGIFGLYDASMNGLAHAKVYMHSSQILLFVKRLKRDTRERGRTVISTVRQYVKSVYPMLKKHVLPTRANADIIVNNSLSKKDFGTEIRKTCAILR